VTDARHFEVRVEGFEPLSLGGTKRRKYDRKASLLKKIEEKIEPNDLQTFRERYQDKLVKVSLVFFLWKGSAQVTNTRFKKDLDNLAKPVLDVLQTYVDEKQTERGLGLIRNDDYVCVLHIAKKLVVKEKHEGIQIVVAEHQDDKMLQRLGEH
jgi:hypothetical protein